MAEFPSLLGKSEMAGKRRHVVKISLSLRVGLANPFKWSCTLWIVSRQGDSFKLVIDRRLSEFFSAMLRCCRWAARSLFREFELVIMIDAATGEMVGSD
jgi:hypothetical protein